MLISIVVRITICELALKITAGSLRWHTPLGAFMPRKQLSLLNLRPRPAIRMGCERSELICPLFNVQLA